MANLTTQTNNSDSGIPVPITGAVLEWAREESGYSLREVAEKLKVSESKILDWEAETTRPNKTQVSNLAKMFRRQRTLFLLPEPPAYTLPPSLRKAPGLDDRELNPDELYIIRKAGRLQEIASLMLEDKKEDRFSPDKYLKEKKNPEEAAKNFREKLGVSVDKQIKSQSPYEAFRLWRSALEEIRVLVFALSMGKENIRGFSFKDNFAPLAVVNTSYKVEARIFTLFHEVGHILTQTDAACLKYAAYDNDKELRTERWCDQFSAAFLMPEEAFLEQAEKNGVTIAHPTKDIEIAEKLANKFKVSTMASSIRLEKLGLARPGFYNLKKQDISKFDFHDGKGFDRRSAAEKKLSELGRLPIEIFIYAYENKHINIINLADFLDLKVAAIEEIKELYQK